MPDDKCVFNLDNEADNKIVCYNNNLLGLVYIVDFKQLLNVECHN